MKPLLFDMCLDRRHALPAFLAAAQGAFITDWVGADAKDHEILALARQLDRHLVTEDSDFGDLIYRDGAPPPSGVMLVMTQLIAPDERARRLALLVPGAIAVAEGHFVVVGPTRLRFRPLPGSVAAS